MRVEVLTGQERRRVWSDERKQEILALAFSPGVRVSEVARRLDINAGQIYRWRKEQGLPSAPGFAKVVIAADDGERQPCRPVRRFEESPVIAVETDRGHVRIWAEASPDLAAAVIRSLTGTAR